MGYQNSNNSNSGAASSRAAASGYGGPGAEDNFNNGNFNTWDADGPKGHSSNQELQQDLGNSTANKNNVIVSVKPSDKEQAVYIHTSLEQRVAQGQVYIRSTEIDTSNVSILEASELLNPTDADPESYADNISQGTGIVVADSGNTSEIAETLKSHSMVAYGGDTQFDFTQRPDPWQPNQDPYTFYKNGARKLTFDQGGGAVNSGRPLASNISENGASGGFIAKATGIYEVTVKARCLVPKLQYKASGAGGAGSNITTLMEDLWRLFVVKNDQWTADNVKYTSSEGTFDFPAYSGDNVYTDGYMANNTYDQVRKLAGLTNRGSVLGFDNLWGFGTSPVPSSGLNYNCYTEFDMKIENKSINLGAGDKLTFHISRNGDWTEDDAISTFTHPKSWKRFLNEGTDDNMSRSNSKQTYDYFEPFVDLEDYGYFDGARAAEADSTFFSPNSWKKECGVPSQTTFPCILNGFHSHIEVKRVS